MADRGSPEWVERNQELRRQLELPEYAPPKFSDGTPVHDVISHIEAAAGSVRIKNEEPTMSDTWTAYLNGEPFFQFERSRTVDGNAVFQVTAEKFVSAANSVAPNGISVDQ